MAGISREEFDALAKEVGAAWEAARTRDDGLRVIVTFGQKHGFKNVMAAIQGRTPRRFDRETTVDQWVADQNREESAG